MPILKYFSEPEFYVKFNKYKITLDTVIHGLPTRINRPVLEMNRFQQCWQKAGADSDEGEWDVRS